MLASMDTFYALRRDDAYYERMLEITRTARSGPIGSARRWPTRDDAEASRGLVPGDWEVVYVEQAGDGWLVDGEYAPRLRTTDHPSHPSAWRTDRRGWHGPRMGHRPLGISTNRRTARTPLTSVSAGQG